MSNPIKIGSKLEHIASVNLSRNTIAAGESVGVYPNNTPVGLSNLKLKPLTYFSYNPGIGSEPGNYVLNVSVITGSHHLPDQNNAIECKTVGKNLLIFLNFFEQGDGIVGTSYNNYRYQFEFSSQFTNSLKGKEIIVVTASGDPEEGSATKVIVEDEDEI